MIFILKQHKKTITDINLPDTLSKKKLRKWFLDLAKQYINPKTQYVKFEHDIKKGHYKIISNKDEYLFDLKNKKSFWSNLFDDLV